MAKKKNTKTSEPVADCNQLSNKVNAGMESPNGVIANCDNLPQSVLETRILTIRGIQVMLDRDLAELYGVPTSRLNEQSKRNKKRFPERFRFQLTTEEVNEVIGNCDRLSSLQYNPSKPYAFTEQGVAMLSSVLHSDEAIEISIRIMDAFVAMRHFLLANAQVFQRLDRIEYKQIEADHRIEELFRKIDERSITPNQGIFFDGQIYDAYEFICGLIKSAKTRIILIDNYADETVLTMLDNQVYLIGASLKDLGKKWFAVALMSETSPGQLLSRL